jgi:hypothetical protein
MGRYLVERTFPEGFALPMDGTGAQVCLELLGNNAEWGVAWVHSYVTLDKQKMFCIYDAPSPEAIRQAAQRNGLPVDQITEVRVLDPYFYT